MRFKMDLEDYRLIPIWLLPIIVLILMLTCNGCRGGRSLGKGSAGTILLQQTPQEINRLNQAKAEQSKPVDIPPPERKPVKQELPSAKPTPIKSEAKAAGKVTPFKPTIETELMPILETKLP